MKVIAITCLSLMTASSVLAKSEAPLAGQTVLGVEVNVAAINANGYSANKLIGANVYNGSDQPRLSGPI